MAGRAGSIPHLPALDGLRGLALLGVLFFHANSALPGGYLGVDLFFVLSGYLITSLLLAEHRDTGGIQLKAFWIRRARRLFPALLSLIPVVALYCWFLAQPDELARVRGDALAALGYVANWRAIFAKTSYWELFAAPSPLEHTWSLSIEEQFYVVWPVVVMIVLRWTGGEKKSIREIGRPILILAAVAALASAIAMINLFDPARTSRAYLGTDTRATSILLGAALATVLPPSTEIDAKKAWQLDLLGGLSTLGIAIAWARLRGQNPFLYKGGFWLTELGALVLIACAVAGPSKSYVAKVLAFRPLTLVGMISYGLYLWHWPINVALTPERTHLSGLLLHAARFTLTFVIAIVSYRYLEYPIRARGLPFGRPIYIVPAAVALSIFLVVRATHARPRTGQPFFPSSPAPSEFTNEPSATTFRVLFLGDSTSNSLGWTLRGVRRRGVAIDLYGKDGCTMLYDTCAETWEERAKEVQPNVIVVFIGGAFMHGMTTKAGEWVKACNAEWDERFQTNLAKRLAPLLSVRASAPQDSDAGAAVRPRVFAVTLPYGLGAWGGDDFHREVDCINADIRAAVAQVSGVEILNLAERICPKGRPCEVESEGAKIRPDGVHYDMAGAREVSAWVFDQLLTPPP